MKNSKLTREKLEFALVHALKKVDIMTKHFPDGFPKASSDGLVYEKEKTDDSYYGWTESFYTGILWIAYLLSKDEKYRETAENLMPVFVKKVDYGVGMNTHDIGFLFTLSTVAAYKITGNEIYREKSIDAAKVLANRFREKGQFIQLAGEADCENPDLYRFIIDTFMNLHLLFWATEETGEGDFAKKGLAHFNTAMETLIREDGSSFQNFYMDQKTGARLGGGTKQGFSAESCWSRGQSWGVTGIPFTYSYMKNDEVIEQYYKITDYYLDHLPEDYIAYWDLCFNDGSGEPRDSSAAAIAVCGLLEAVKVMPLDNEHKKRYKQAAEDIMNSLIDSYTTKDDEMSNGLIKHGTYYYGGNQGIDECCIWGDYFYIEALARFLDPDFKKFW